MIKEINEILNEIEDVELNKLKQDVDNLEKDYYNSKSFRSSPKDNGREKFKSSTKPIINANSLPFNLSPEDFSYLEFDNAGRLRMFVTKPIKNRQFRGELKE